jgi:hypothetical protein
LIATAFRTWEGDATPNVVEAHSLFSLHARLLAFQSNNRPFEATTGSGLGTQTRQPFHDTISKYIQCSARECCQLAVDESSRCGSVLCVAFQISQSATVLDRPCEFASSAHYVRCPLSSTSYSSLISHPHTTAFDKSSRNDDEYCAARSHCLLHRAKLQINGPHLLAQPHSSLIDVVIIMNTASLSPGVASHPHARHTRTSPASRSTTSRTPASVGQPLPPFRANNARSPNTYTPRSPSPNYFALSTRADECMSSGGGVHARTNWSPPTSNIRSAAAASPRVVPVDQNPEFESFRRQSERAGFNSGSLSSFSIGAPTPRASKKPAMSSVGLNSPSRPLSPLTKPTSTTTKNETNVPEAKQRSPKRLLSSPVPGLTDRPRRNSPAGFTEREAEAAPKALHLLLAEDRDARLSLPNTNDQNPALLINRADTLPTALNEQTVGAGGSEFMSPDQLVRLFETAKDDVLLLDLRVSTQYAKSRIEGALNLCIPTTLLKRPSYNTNKLAETFKLEEQRQKFERWRNCKHIIVYDASSSKVKDATPCVKMLEKFSNEGWTGASHIIRGGFAEFSRRFLKFVSHGSAVATGGSMFHSSGNPSLPPVIGGCPMPITANSANPFFSNIRQNMDLIGGVGQMSLQLPSSMTKQQEQDLPHWLKSAVDPQDDGKIASDKFLGIEKKEQKRMQEALSGTVVYGSPRYDMEDEKPVQLAGIEKGAKNRYNNIWPFEHSRVKLEGVPSDCCDYFNANFVRTEWSNKQYIATQGPIPATFNVSIPFLACI